MAINQTYEFQFSSCEALLSLLDMKALRELQPVNIEPHAPKYHSTPSAAAVAVEQTLSRNLALVNKLQAPRT
jgi:hypothetical protein